MRSRDISEFRGPDLLHDAAAKRGGLLARNVEYRVGGSVKTRNGFAEFYDPNEAIRSLFHWIQATWNRLVYFTTSAGGAIRSRNLDTATTKDLVESGLGTGVGAVFIEFGSRLLMAVFASDGRGAAPGHIWNGLETTPPNPAAPNVDQLFQAPLAETSDFTAAFSEPAAGTVTAGSHRIALVVETRNGYQTVPTRIENATGSVDGDNNFLATGDKNFRAVLTPVGDWPVWPRFAFILMTTADNPNRYFFVPDPDGGDQKTSIAFGTPLAVTIDIDVSDAVLAQGNDATDWFNLHSGNFDNGPHFIGIYGARAVYLEDSLNTDFLAEASNVWFSDVADPQRISAARNQRFLPGYRRAIAGFEMLGTYYVLGPSWTYAFTDNDQDPVTWRAPQEVDSRIGTLSPLGVDVNTSGALAWVASEHGLFYFDGGSYPLLPTSHLQTPDWDRINWAAPAGTVQVIDDSPQQVVHVLAPLDGAVLPTHILSWSYKTGPRWDQAGLRYSLSLIGGVANPGALTTVLNPTTKIRELWLADAAAGKVYRQKSNAAGDADLYHDDTAAIDSRYDSQALPETFPLPLHHARDLIRLKGNGRARLSVLGVDGERTIQLQDEVLNGAPKKWIDREYDLRSEAAYLSVNNNNVRDQWFELAFVRHFYDRWVGEI